jgi:NitT/TauT family transport system ATP-binding protein
MSILERVTELPTAPQPDICIDGVSKRFGRGRVILADVTLHVEALELVCLLGASGCGKSTLLNLVAGLDRPSSGTVTTAGGRPSLMFQESALLPWLTAAQNIELALKLEHVGRAARRERAQELLEVVRLRDTGRKRVHELSGGMRQRVAMARALAQQSRVLLMDEPFAALDAITRDVLHEELIRLRHEQGLTVLFVTHNVREAVRLGDRVVLMSSRPGRVARVYPVDLPQPRLMEANDLVQLSARITEDLREEIRRHGEKA